MNSSDKTADGQCQISANGLNRSARRIVDSMLDRARELKIAQTVLPCGTHVIDCGVEQTGGLAAGLALATACMAGKATLSLVSGDRQVCAGPWVQVESAHPVEACMMAQYAGWPVKHEKFFAMGSGPMRVRRGREELLMSLSASDPDDLAVGTLECDSLPEDDLALMMATECCVAPEQLWLLVAPTRSLAGCVQVVARSVETALHKMHESGFDLTQVKSAYGLAPVPPPTPDFTLGIGRTNDAILYGGQVTLWVEGRDSDITELGPALPSSASADFGAPFAEVFKRYEYDFYKVDPGLFSPAEITICNFTSGNSFRFGGVRGDLVSQSFGTQQGDTKTKSAECKN